MNPEAVQANPYEGMKGDPQSPDFDFWAQPPHVRQALADDGFPVPKRPMPKEEPKKGKSKRKKGETPLMIAQSIVEAFEGPLAYAGSYFWVFTEARGWEICDSRLYDAANLRFEKNAEQQIVPIIRSRVTLPSVDETAEAPIYWERIGGRWEGHWQPLKLKQTEILYTDHIYDVVGDDVVAELGGRIVWGPMISLPWTTDSGEAPPIDEIEAFMATRIPNADIRAHFQEVMGCILQPHVVLRGQVVLWGPPGSGKTTVAMAIAHAPAGAIGVAQQQEADLARNKWSRNQLVNRFVNISDDSARVSEWVGFVKRYSSGTFTSEAKYGRPTTSPATAKLISTCNEMQDIADSSGAMVDRLIPFKMEMRVEGDWNPDLMTPQHWSKADTRASMVEWLVQGLKRLRTRGRFDPPQAWLVQKGEAIAEGDSLEGWLVDNIEQDDGTGEGLTSAAILEKVPASLANKKSDRSLETQIGKYICRLFRSEKERAQKDGKRYRVFTGIRWRE